MTERIATLSPENEKRAELSQDERALLNVERADEWRDMQYGVLGAMRHKAELGDDSYVGKFNDSIDDALESYLNAQGVAEDSTRRDELRRVYRGISIDRISDSEWYASPSSRGETEVEPDKDTSRRDQFTKLTSSFNQSEADSTDQETEIDELKNKDNLAELSDEDLERNLSQSRDKWATLSAKRQGRARNQRIHGYNKARDDYNKLAREKARRDSLDVINDEDAEQVDKNVAVILSMIKEDKQLRELTTEKLQGTKVTGFINWMNKGGPVRRIGKGILLGAGVGLAGSVIAGAAGATLLAGGAIATATAGTRAFRGYAAADRDKRGMFESIDANSQANLQEYAAGLDPEDDSVEKIHSRLSGMFEDGSQMEQSKRRRAVAWGVGTMAVGATIGYAAHAGIEAWSGRDLQILPRYSDSPSLDTPKHVPGSEHTGGTTDTGNPNHDQTPHGADSSDSSSESTADPNSQDKLDVGSDFAVEDGHGYTQELIDAAKANGVDMSPEQAWAAHQEIVDQVGQDYIDLNGNSGADTYAISGDQYDVGISDQGQATWSAEAQPLVADAIDDGDINGSVDGTDTSLDQTASELRDNSVAETPVESDNASDISGIEAAKNDGSNLAYLRGNIDTIANMINSGQFDELNADYSLQDALSYLSVDLSDTYYPGTSTPIVAYDMYSDRWVVNSVPRGSYLPESVNQALQNYKR